MPKFSDLKLADPALAPPAERPQALMRAPIIPKFDYDSKRLSDPEYAQKTLEIVSTFILNEYASKYERLDPILDEKLKYIKELEDFCVNTAQQVTTTNAEIAQSTQSIEKRIETLKAKNITIQERLGTLKKELLNMKALGMSGETQI